MGKSRFQKEKCYQTHLSQQVAAEQQFLAGVLPEVLKNAILGYLARGTPLFSLRLSHLKKKKRHPSSMNAVS